MDNLQKLEKITTELLAVFEISSPPVPIESMLQHPKPQMWETLDITQLSGTFLTIKERYSPRMSLARLLARHAAASVWGKEHGLYDVLQEEPQHLNAFARMLLMPAEMVQELRSGAFNPTTMSMVFEIPEEDARLRLQDLL